jgi:cephalosporin-C deacetylase-like acetyl esterase
VHREVTFRVKEYKLTGRLILPESEKKVPVLVWIEGSGPHSLLNPERRE